MIKLLMVDDHALVREGFRLFFDCVEDIEVGAEAGSGEEALAILQQQTFDLILLDITLPGIHGVDLIKMIGALPKSPPILILSMHNDAQTVKRKLKAGVAGYIAKDCLSHELLAAVRKVAGGGRFVAPGIAEKIVFEATVAAQAPHESLSPRELSILRMLVKGKKNNEIAVDLNISHKTVSTHKVSLMQKMNINNDAQLMQYGITYGLCNA